MSVDDRQQKAEHIRHLLETEGDSVHENTQVFNDGRYESTAALDDYERLKDEARAIKEDAIERLPELVEQVTETVEANGGTVYRAYYTAEANEKNEEVRDVPLGVERTCIKSDEHRVNE